jgi:hypothetical protein
MRERSSEAVSADVDSNELLIDRASQQLRRGGPLDHLQD